jgi:WXG100 family type VII secretion target
MSSRIGADIGQLQHLSSKFSSDSSDLSQMIGSISGQLGSTWWEGPARQAFDANWGTMQSTLNQLVQALQDCAQEASRRASAIEAAGS